MFDRRLLKNFDWPLLAATLLLSLIGILTIYSTAKPYCLKQFAFLGLGLFALIIVFSIDYHRWARWAFPLYLGGLFLLLSLFFFGHSALGAQRWLHIGHINFQPSEIVKLTTILFLVRFLSRKEEGIFWPDLITSLIILIFPFLLISLQPDLGTALFFLPLGLILVYLAGAKGRHLFLLVAFFLLTSPLAWFLLHDYQKRRLLTFLNPTRDPLGAGYNIIQSKIAIGSGRFLGKGFLHSTQSSFLPGHHTDFIFSPFAEEWGFLGSLLLLGIYLFLIMRAIEISLQAKDRLGSLLAAGMATLLASQIIINIGMATGILPATGLPLSLLSYGGSHLVTCLVSIGFLLNIRMRRFMF